MRQVFEDRVLECIVQGGAAGVSVLALEAEVPEGRIDGAIQDAIRSLRRQGKVEDAAIGVRLTAAEWMRRIFFACDAIGNPTVFLSAEKVARTALRMLVPEMTEAALDDTALQGVARKADHRSDAKVSSFETIYSRERAERAERLTDKYDTFEVHGQQLRYDSGVFFGKRDACMAFAVEWVKRNAGVLLYVTGKHSQDRAEAIAGRADAEFGEGDVYRKTLQAPDPLVRVTHVGRNLVGARYAAIVSEVESQDREWWRYVAQRLRADERAAAEIDATLRAVVDARPNAPVEGPETRREPSMADVLVRLGELERKVVALEAKLVEATTETPCAPTVYDAERLDLTNIVGHGAG